MTLNPIHKVLSTIRQHQVQCLLMGGQACVLYGAAEFSRDTDFAVLSSPDNLARLQPALDELQAECIAVPPFKKEYLDRGHAIHFRCKHPDAAEMRIDIMARLRGVESFEALWERRVTLDLDSRLSVEVMSLPDLVQAKKTQRDKDWPMLRRLLEADFFARRDNATPDMIRFWLLQLRSPALLRALALAHPDAIPALIPLRPMLASISTSGDEEIDRQLSEEERRERDIDRRYWEPLRRDLEALRHRRQQ